jgi:hypothetical protein
MGASSKATIRILREAGRAPANATPSQPHREDALMDTPRRNEALRLVRDIRTYGANHTPWEETFLDDMEHKLTKEMWSPTPRQLEVLQKIYEEKC